MNKDDPVTLDCTASGYPAANITWTKASDGSVVTMPLNITGKRDEGVYRCTADNGVGDPVSSDVSITVHSKYKYCPKPFHPYQFLIFSYD